VGVCATGGLETFLGWEVALLNCWQIGGGGGEIAGFGARRQNVVVFGGGDLGGCLQLLKKLHRGRFTLESQVARRILGGGPGLLTCVCRKQVKGLLSQNVLGGACWINPMVYVRKKLPATREFF